MAGMIFLEVYGTEVRPSLLEVGSLMRVTEKER